VEALELKRPSSNKDQDNIKPGRSYIGWLAQVAIAWLVEVIGG
jgi:hypothetical protein